MRKVVRVVAVVALALIAVEVATAAGRPECDQACLEGIGAQYRAAYVKHDPSLAPFARDVRFTENNVELQFPDGTWDTTGVEATFVAAPYYMRSPWTHHPDRR